MDQLVPLLCVLQVGETSKGRLAEDWKLEVREKIRALVVRRSRVRSVARGDDGIDSLFDASTLTSSVSVAWAIDGSRMARRQMALHL